MEKTPDFDYTCIPHDYAHCFNHECPRADQCLRHFVGLNVPKDMSVVRCLTSSVWSADAALCIYYRTMKKVTPAWGITNIVTGILPHLAVAIRHDIRHLWLHLHPSS